MNVKENIVIVGNESSCSFQMCMQGFITVIVNKRQIQNIDLYTCIYSLTFCHCARTTYDVTVSLNDIMFYGALDANDNACKL